MSGEGARQQSWADCWSAIRADVYRATGEPAVLAVPRRIWRSPVGRYLVAMRLCAWARSSTSRLPILAIVRPFYRHWSAVYGLEIPYVCHIGPGLKVLHHSGGVVVNSQVTIGRRCTIGPGVTVGRKRTGERAGSPVIGDDVTISTGAKLIGGIVIGDRVTIGANSVATKSIPPDTVVAGIPAAPLPGATPEPPTFGDIDRFDRG